VRRIESHLFHHVGLLWLVYMEFTLRLIFRFTLWSIPFYGRTYCCSSKVMEKRVSMRMARFSYKLRIFLYTILNNWQVKGIPLEPQKSAFRYQKCVRCINQAVVSFLWLFQCEKKSSEFYRSFTQRRTVLLIQNFLSMYVLTFHSVITCYFHCYICQKAREKDYYYS